MKIHAVYIHNNSLKEIKIQGWMLPDEQKENMRIQPEKYPDHVQMLVDSLERPNNFTMIKPFFHPHFPNEVLRIAIGKMFDEIDLSKIKILECEYPEQKWKLNETTGQLEEIFNEEEKRVKSELGG